MSTQSSTDCQLLHIPHARSVVAARARKIADELTRWKVTQLPARLNYYIKIINEQLIDETKDCATCFIHCGTQAQEHLLCEELTRLYEEVAYTVVSCRRSDTEIEINVRLPSV